MAGLAMLEFHLYRDCFSSAEMRDIWSEQATIEAWLKVEQVLARCQANAGLIPPEAATAIAAIEARDLDIAALAEDMALVGRPIVGLVKQMRARAGAQAHFVHHLSTTQDIMDTALAMQMRLGLAWLDRGVHALVTLLDGHIAAHPDTMIMGRTNGQHAVPLRLASKLGVWRAELLRRRAVLNDAGMRGLNVQMGGPVGDLRGYPPGKGEAVRAAVAHCLGLHVVAPNWQSARDGIADIVGAAGVLCATLCKIAHTLNLLASTDIGAVSESYRPGLGASSSMAHKKNQRASEFAEAVARMGRQRSEQMGELTIHEHERSGGVWIAEWVVVPEVFLLASGAVAWSQLLLESLEFHLG
jgi:3-carboxy-cis,cis-muconate cycloisomerase